MLEQTLKNAALAKGDDKESRAASSRKKTQKAARPLTKANEALIPKVAPLAAFTDPELQKAAFYADENVLILNMDVKEAMAQLARAGVTVNCIVTSPPFYGQRDYGVKGQIGLEEHPQEFIAKLVDSFEASRPVLAETGSLWVNLGDTYWSGKGEHKSGETKQSARRFGLRPQDRTGDGLLCRPKQLLLIPHRFAIAMGRRVTGDLDQKRIPEPDVVHTHSNLVAVCFFFGPCHLSLRAGSQSSSAPACESRAPCVSHTASSPNPCRTLPHRPPAP